MYPNQLSSTPMTSSTGLAGAVGVPTVSEIDQELGGLTTSTMHLVELVSNLHNRLQPILRQAEPSTGSGGAEKRQSPVTKIGASIRSNEEQIYGAKLAIQDMLRRLEV